MISSINNVDTALKLSHPSFGSDDKDNPIQPEELTAYNRELEILKKKIINDEIRDDLVFNLKYDDFKTFISNKAIQLQDSLTKKNELLTNIVRNAVLMFNSTAPLMRLLSAAAFSAFVLNFELPIQFHHGEDFF